MRTALSLPLEIYNELKAHLLPDDAEIEEAAMVFASVRNYADLMQLDYKDWYPVPSEDYVYQSSGYIELTDKARAAIIKHAHDLNACLVEFHSHPYPYEACFSWSDLLGFKEFVPHIWWRLPDRPYAAVVVSPSGFDALIWIDNPEDAKMLDAMKIGDQIMYPTGRTLKWSVDNG